MKLSLLVELMDAERIGPESEVSYVSIDSRVASKGHLFVAIKGERFDGHDFLTSVLDSDVTAVMVSQGWVKAHQSILKQWPSIAWVVVADTRIGLGDLARAWLSLLRPKTVAITGSSGKTTVKEMVAAILSNEGETLATLGNLNNDIGVPLTLCRLNEQHRFAVIEMGANHAGEIAYTAGLVKPDVALVNNVGPAHLEGFGSIEKVAYAKSEIYEQLDAAGTAVINLDDAFKDVFMDKSEGHPWCTYSVRDDSADVYLLDRKVSALDNEFTVSLQGQVVDIQLSLMGQHNIANALAAMAIARTVGASISAIQSGLASLKPIAGRLCPVRSLPEMTVIDDSYNANPGSVKSAIDVLVDGCDSTCLVLGTMAELGADAENMHREVGEYAAKKGVKRFYVMGSYAEALTQGFLKPGLEGSQVMPMHSHQQIAQALLKDEKDKRIMIKGSRSAAMDKVIRFMEETVLINEEVR